ncbi:MerR family transcriptional regulator [Saccharomonospora piscinae]|uniref:helix-turn-helix domain-containing protein n=1 Tax=Saccharomonospora piscinae TaxID=687388 RepID=UPI000466F66C|nr:MerR family transcriptional regulator [Saccharomonospora piscinae]
MAWSTRQLADLAGTTIKAIRHYHRIGLLDVPERASNGYKQYRTEHLVRLLHIRRLSDLGLPLSQIAEMSDGDSDESIRALDDELAATIERLQRLRAELALVLRHRAPTDLPAQFGPVAHNLSDADRALIAVCSRLFTPKTMGVIQTMASVSDDTDRDFRGLSADADEDTIKTLAARMAPLIRNLLEQYPLTEDPAAQRGSGPTSPASVVTQALADLYNPAQLRVIHQVNDLLADDSDR